MLSTSAVNFPELFGG